MLQVAHPSEPDWVIMADDYRVLGKDKSISSFWVDNRDGLKETFILLNAFGLDKGLDSIVDHWKQAIIYPDKQTADEVLERIKDKLNTYFGAQDWKVVKLLTIHFFDSGFDGENYGCEDLQPKGHDDGNSV